jgi:hypothetical protein
MTTATILGNTGTGHFCQAESILEPHCLAGEFWSSKGGLPFPRVRIPGNFIAQGSLEAECRNRKAAGRVSHVFQISPKGHVFLLVSWSKHSHATQNDDLITDRLLIWLWSHKMLLPSEVIVLLVYVSALYVVCTTTKSANHTSLRKYPCH